MRSWRADPLCLRDARRKARLVNGQSVVEAAIAERQKFSALYYNEVRTHLALGKDAPLGRAVQRSGVIVAIPILSGLHHHYVWI
jgi:hypothetical protein